MEIKAIHKTKTFWAALAGLVGVVGGVVVGEIGLAEAIPAAAGFITAMFFRRGLAKGSPE